MTSRHSSPPTGIALQRILLALWWGTVALLIAALALRFALRLLGVRPDIPFPGFVYSLTTPVVEPFYRFFPVSDRFDYYALEWASILAAGCVLSAALIIYAIGLLLSTLVSRPARSSAPTNGPVE